MATLTNPAAIPTALRPDIIAVCQEIGPVILGDRYPAENGEPKATLTVNEAVTVFELVTREFWRQQIASHKANAAAEAARLAAIDASADDPFTA